MSKVVGQSAPRVVRLTGPITVYEVASLRETLRSALGEAGAGGTLEIDLADSGPWDIAGLQLLIACVASARERESIVAIRQIPRFCEEVAVRSGLSDWLLAAAG
jgi:ABC-type transporter Mla MlaB component